MYTGTKWFPKKPRIYGEEKGRAGRRSKQRETAQNSTGCTAPGIGDTMTWTKPARPRRRRQRPTGHGQTCRPLARGATPSIRSSSHLGSAHRRPTRPYQSWTHGAGQSGRQRLLWSGFRGPKRTDMDGNRRRLGTWDGVEWTKIPGAMPRRL